MTTGITLYPATSNIAGLIDGVFSTLTEPLLKALIINALLHSLLDPVNFISTLIHCCLSCHSGPLQDQPMGSAIMVKRFFSCLVVLGFFPFGFLEFLGVGVHGLLKAHCIFKIIFSFRPERDSHFFVFVLD